MFCHLSHDTKNLPFCKEVMGNSSIIGISIKILGISFRQ